MCCLLSFRQISGTFCTEPGKLFQLFSSFCVKPSQLAAGGCSTFAIRRRWWYQFNHLTLNEKPYMHISPISNYCLKNNMISCVCVLKLDTRLQGRHGLLCPCTDRCFFFTCFKRTRKVFIRRFSAAFDFFPPFFENLLSPTFTWPRAGREWDRNTHVKPERISSFPPVNKRETTAFSNWMEEGSLMLIWR